MLLNTFRRFLFIVACCTACACASSVLADYYRTAPIYDNTIESETDHSEQSNTEGYAFIQQLQKKCREVYRNNELDEHTISVKLASIVENYVAIPEISHAVLAGYRGQITTSQRDRFNRLYHNYMLYFYTAQLYQYVMPEMEKIIESRMPNGNYLVRTKLLNSSDARDFTIIDFILIKQNDKFKVYNIYYSGVNLLITQQSLFNNKIKARGIEAVLTELELEGRN